MSDLHPIVAIVPARGGSRGVPRKNVLEIAGKPLIVHTIEAAQAAPSIDRVVVTTDDAEIAAISRNAGAEVPFLRPAHLADDKAGMVDTVLHTIDELERDDGPCCETIALLQPTSPLRTAQEIEDSIDFMRTSGADSVISVSRCESAHPYYQYYVREGRPEPILDVPNNPQRRQDYPGVYLRNGSIYLVRRSVFVEKRSFYGDELQAFETDAETSVNIDSPLDFQFARFLMSQRP